MAADGNYSINNPDVQCFTYEIDSPDDGKYIYIRLVDSTSIDVINAYEAEVECREQIVVSDNAREEEGSKSCEIETIDLKKV